MSEPDHYTASVCARLCLRRHAVADSAEAALAVARQAMCQAVRAAVAVAHDQGCEVEIDGEYLVSYPSVPPEPRAVCPAIRPFEEPQS